VNELRPLWFETEAPVEVLALVSLEVEDVLVSEGVVENDGTVMDDESVVDDVGVDEIESVVVMVEVVPERVSEEGSEGKLLQVWLSKSVM
jgi:hypothetical protein